MEKKFEDLDLVDPVHLTQVSDGYGEFPNGYKLTEKGIEEILKINVPDVNSEHHKSFQEKINQLILSTPSGELRNTLTDLNILHEICMRE